MAPIDTIVIRKKFWVFMVMVQRINIGAIFCHVRSVRVVIHDRFMVTFGSHQ